MDYNIFVASASVVGRAMMGGSIVLTWLIEANSGSSARQSVCAWACRNCSLVLEDSIDLGTLYGKGRPWCVFIVMASGLDRHT